MFPFVWGFGFGYPVGMNRTEIVRIFRQDPARAFDRIPESFLGEVLEVLTPYAWQAGGALWRDPEAQTWLSADLRWAELCWKYRRDLDLGLLAREALRQLPEAVLEGFLKTRSSEVSRLEPDEEALRQARTLMLRVAQAADLVASRLERSGWKSLSGPLRSAPRPEAIAALAQTNGVGTLPASLQAFWEIVGGINFVWDYESREQPPDFGLGLPLQRMDPLCISGPEDLFYCVEEWQLQDCRAEVAEPLELELAPDVYHKADISGGAPYAISLPALSHDPILENERHGLPFTDYLRLAFRWGGFPGLEEYAHLPEVQKFLADMTGGLPALESAT